ncbi:hypothetical protein F4781DRAFT_428336 [Annulohypoxylon bovei var. microspora]|nr:hypothetical protein F4781DRAFT_428336 [Annulohypoxylon bovei var. microspora]
MASRHSQYRQYGDSREHSLSQNGSTLAYDSNGSLRETRSPSSPSREGMGRTLRRVPKDAKLSSSFSNWLGRHKAKKGESPEGIRISDPILIQQAPARPRRPSVALAPQLGHGSQIRPELVVPKPPPKNPGVQKQNLGNTREALRSHPVTPRSDTRNKDISSQQGLKYSDNSRDSRVARSEAVRSQRTPVEPQPAIDVKAKRMAEIKADRRKGRIFLDGTNLYEFPNPENWQGGDDNGDDGHIWEDAGFNDPYTPATNDRPVPEITVTQPTDDEEESTQSEEIPQRLLAVEDCYKVLWQGQKKEIRGLRESLRYLVPLAWLIAESEGVDLNDMVALEGALKTIIADREKLFDLFPLAQVLADDQKVDIDDFTALPRALKNVMSDRDSAKRMSDYHRMVRQRLEGRIAQLEKGRNDDTDDDEEYMRL